MFPDLGAHGTLYLILGGVLIAGLLVRRVPIIGTLVSAASWVLLVGLLVIVVGQPGEPEAAGEDEVNAALAEAMTRLSPSRAAAEVSEKLGLPKREVYERALALK